MSRLAAIIIGLVTVVSATLVGSSNEAPAAESDILIGVINPLSGPQASLGEAYRFGGELAIEEINNAGGVNGRKLRAIVRDDEGNPTKGVSAAQELIHNEGVKVIMGANATTVALAINPVANEAKVIFFTLGTGTAVVDPVKFPYTWRINIYNQLEAQAILDYAFNVLKAKKPGILTDNTGYGKGGQGDLTAQLDKAGIKPVAVENFNVNDTDMTGQLMRIKNAGADVIFCWGNGNDVATISKGIDKLGIDLKAVCSSGASMSNFKDLAGDSYKLVLSSNSKNVTFPDGQPAPAKTLALIDRIEKKFGKDARITFASTVPWYDMIYMYADLVKKAGSEDPDKIEAAFETTTDWQGVNGTYSLSPTQHDGFNVKGMTISWAGEFDRWMYKRAPGTD